MDESFDRQLRGGLRRLIDPVNGAHPSWQSSPASERVMALPAAWHSRLWARSGGRRDVAWLAAGAVLLLIALLGLVVGGGGPDGDRSTSGGCPDGMDPYVPGDVSQARPAAHDPAGPMVWDTEASRLVLLPGGRTPAWTFDVCTNTWRANTRETPIWWRPPGALVHDEDSGLTIAIGDQVVGAYDTGTDTWTIKGPASMVIAQAAYDPRSGRVFVRDQAASRLWNYDVDADSWLEIQQGSVLPPEEGDCGSQFLDYDRAVDRLVLYLESCQWSGPETWLFDPRAGGWSKAAVVTPTIDLFIGNDQMVYDAPNARSVVYAGGRIAAYDSVRNRWEVLFDAGPNDGRFDRVGNALAFDPLNGRLVVVGGLMRTSTVAGWQVTDDIVAFDVRTRTWIELLAPSGS